MLSITNLLAQSTSEVAQKPFLKTVWLLYQVEDDLALEHTVYIQAI